MFNIGGWGSVILGGREKSKPQVLPLGVDVPS